MARHSRNKLLVPGAREALDAWVKAGSTTTQKATAAHILPSAGLPPNNRPGGDITAREAGHAGGQVGGPMVRRLVEIAEQHLAQDETGFKHPQHP